MRASASLWLPATLAGVEGEFVGRVAAWADLVKLWDVAATGSAQVGLLAGEQIGRGHG